MTSDNLRFNNNVDDSESITQQFKQGIIRGYNGTLLVPGPCDHQLFPVCESEELRINRQNTTSDPHEGHASRTANHNRGQLLRFLLGGQG